jgi:hypothetical protein
MHVDDVEFARANDARDLTRRKHVGLAAHLNTVHRNPLLPGAPAEDTAGPAHQFYAVATLGKPREQVQRLRLASAPGELLVDMKGACYGHPPAGISTSVFHEEAYKTTRSRDFGRIKMRKIFMSLYRTFSLCVKAESMDDY